MSDVVVVGSGPTGMVLAGELALAGVDVTVLERRTTPELAGSRAGGFHARTIEVLDQRGIADRFLAEGTTVQVASFGATLLDISHVPTRHPYTLGLWQNHIERILRGWVDELGVRIRYGVDVTGVAQDGSGVDVHVVGAEPLRASYVVACDGGHSVVRRAAGIGFEGVEATRSHLIAEVEVTEDLPDGVHHDDLGVHGLSLMDDGRTVRVVTTEATIGPPSEPSLADLAAALRLVFGADFGVHSPTWISRFTDATRQATSYRAGRVLVAGDAAHVHHPAGGQGIGLGVQDAVNLGWKLAQVAGGTSPDGLLDSYHAERHPAGARALDWTMALSMMQKADPRTAALRGVVDSVLVHDAPRDELAARATGLDIAYELGEGHPLLGRRVPDLDLVVDGAPTRLVELLRPARWVLLDLGRPGLDASALADRVRVVRAAYDGEWRLPVLGVVTAPTAVLVRPDGHVAWVGEGSVVGLEAALTTWVGVPGTDDTLVRPVAINS